MYISGSIEYLESRLHQLATTSGDFNNFIAEAQSYSSAITGNHLEYLIHIWNKELTKKGSPNLITGFN